MHVSLVFVLDESIATRLSGPLVVHDVDLKKINKNPLVVRAHSEAGEGSRHVVYSAQVSFPNQICKNANKTSRKDDLAQNLACKS